MQDRHYSYVHAEQLIILRVYTLSERSWLMSEEAVTCGSNSSRA